MTWLLKLIGFDPVGKIVDGLTKWQQIKENAKNDADRIRADVEIKRLETRLDAAKTGADVIKTGMQFKAFWIPWLIATVPVSLWFGWGMIDSLCNGALPDVAALPPQLKAYADIVWQNVFYTGAAGMGVEVLGRVLRR
ncbi:MAG: hypothetical protein E5V72_01015 [Mesorhizobium sp.]|uniref:hypothetical protein n=1 Tax=Mesorhizobium sp. TaxID=1871066 RepID=UPI000FE52BB1|nr:hypothetical protein [Mesorhizobium sp.]RWD47469.1 MAG: hypothetical protein EOS35_06400 [Mesorhizobium sp.]RWI74796.1 MAG: hypothetical protein EOR19_20140 [Mesorhizobium sp.]RWJ33289.1 MAG: hypothetical protein EOR28_11935 [Mesorhizobium sp.]TIQ68280.1 MAG: hypothetical protein E5X40_30155 [Mesorhizobium sp.]TIW50899.1 MAG: hypothetical protein E5V72_01015 [Mesorhizobium sp.]